MFCLRSFSGVAAVVVAYSLVFPGAGTAQGLLGSGNTAGATIFSMLAVGPPACDNVAVSSSASTSSTKTAPASRDSSAADSPAPAPCISKLPATTVREICALKGMADSGCSSADDPAGARILALGKRGATIVRARALVLEILQNENPCSAWYKEKDANPGATFQSVEFEIDEKGQMYISEAELDRGLGLFHHPYTAMTQEGGGAGATITLNGNGAFFQSQAVIRKMYRDGGSYRPGGIRQLRLGLYTGDTIEAQITALLHEFGHTVVRIPADPDPTDGQSGRNTAEVLRYCRAEVESAAKHPLRMASR